MAEPGNIVALFSPTEALELCYSNKVIESCFATEDVFNHVIEKGTAYLLVQYYEKKPNS